MLYMTEGSFAWVAVKYTSSTTAAILENTWTPSSKNFHVSHSILKSGIVAASDILMVEDSSSVYANMSTAAAFSTIRNNILAGCYWFTGTHDGNDLTGCMRPYATGAQIPDAKATNGEYPCCTQGMCNSASWSKCPPQYDCSIGVFLSNGNNTASHLQLNVHARMRSGAHSLQRTHSIWLRIPLTTLVSASLLPASLPVPQGLIAMYTADSWQPAGSLTTASWMDLSGAANHVTDIAGTTSISVARPVGAPAYIYGAPTASMRFPAGILPPSADYTLFFVARYNGAVRRRIFQGINIHWLSGFWGGQAGVALHDGDRCSWMTAEVDVHGHDWVMGVDRSDSFRSNGVDRTTRTTTCAAADNLAINNGSAASENSDFAIQSVLVYNRKLSDADVMKVEAWLTSQMPAFTPANLQASLLVGLVFHRFFLNSSVNIHRIFTIACCETARLLTIICRAWLASTTRATSPPAAAPAPGPPARASSAPSLALPLSEATAWS